MVIFEHISGFEVWQATITTGERCIGGTPTNPFRSSPYKFFPHAVFGIGGYPILRIRRYQILRIRGHASLGAVGNPILGILKTI